MHNTWQRTPVLAGSRLSIALFMLAGSMVMTTGCKQNQAAPVKMPPMQVGVVSVEQRDVPLYGNWIGNLDGNVNAQIQPQVSGYLIRQDYHEGQHVKKGDVLYEIDPRSFQASLDQAEGQLGQAKAQLMLSQINVKRDTPLVEAHALAKSQLDNDTQQVAQYEALVKTDQAAVDAAKLNLGWTKVRSLVDGIAGLASVQIGNLVNTSTVLTTVSQVNPVRAYFAISEQEYLTLNQSAKEKGASDLLRSGSKIPLELTLADGQKYPLKGTIIFVDRQVDNQTGTIRIAGAFENPSYLLRPGQFAHVSALTGTRHDAIIIPQRAVVDLQGQHQVAVVGPNNIVQIRKVVTGKQVGQDWIVESGLNAGEKIITEGNGKVRDGMPVIPIADNSDAKGSR